MTRQNACSFAVLGPVEPSGALPGPLLAPRRAGLGRHNLRHQDPGAQVAVVGRDRSPTRRPHRSPCRGGAVRRLFRTIMTTAVDDGLLRSNPVSIKGAAAEDHHARPVPPPMMWPDSPTRSSPDSAPSSGQRRPRHSATASSPRCVAAMSTSRDRPSGSSEPWPSHHRPAVVAGPPARRRWQRSPVADGHRRRPRRLLGREGHRHCQSPTGCRDRGRGRQRLRTRTMAPRHHLHARTTRPAPRRHHLATLTASGDASNARLMNR
jgi:hypothetical protein